ncbi:MAG TPA: Rab family GTPase [Candidatus Deferrimicrobium sp.]|nr:Rab family GTPase [Candidatus Deferrimicrobium sp.]
MIEKELIKGIIYSQFDDKAGPIPIVWVPSNISDELKNLISLKTINILAGDSEEIPESLAFIPFPSLNLKGLVKFIEIQDETRRGRTIDSSITLLFDEADDLIFYKYIKNFETIFADIAKKIINLAEKKASSKKLFEEMKKFENEIREILIELREGEVPKGKEAFPKAAEPESTGYRYKLIVVGDPHVGKTSTILRYTDNAFRRTYIPTIGVNLSEKQIKYKENEIKFVLWDIAGQSKFQKMRNYFYKGADGQLLVFDLTAPESFANIPNWYKDIKLNLKGKVEGLILANKNDLVNQRKVGNAEIAKLAGELNLEYFETSALTGDNINKVFERIADLLYQKGKIKVSEQKLKKVTRKSGKIPNKGKKSSKKPSKKKRKSN